MKKIIAVFTVLCILTCSFCFVGCSNNDKDDKLSIVTTIFPEYDWVRQILGDEAKNVELTLLLDSGVDLHNYQPTAKDIVTLASCDMFIYVGGHSDEWVEDALRQANNKDMVIINLFDVLGDAVKEDTALDGEEHDHEHEHEDDGHVHENDEHVWLSISNAKAVCREIAEKLALIDPENADVYNGNLNAYCEQLSTLDAEYKALVEDASCKTLLFGDRFPFRYLADDYGLEYYAAFSGCSAESEASFETIARLAAKVDELNLSAVIKIEGSSSKIAETVINTSTSKNAEILTLDSMQATTLKAAQGGTTYISIMRSNLQVLAKALK